jgi:hypothetical protein
VARRWGSDRRLPPGWAQLMLVDPSEVTDAEARSTRVLGTNARSDATGPAASRSDDVGRSLAADPRQKAKDVIKKDQRETPIASRTPSKPLHPVWTRTSPPQRDRPEPGRNKS